MLARHSFTASLAAVCVFLCGCPNSSSRQPQDRNQPLSPPEIAAKANQEFLSRRRFDPWLLTSEGSAHLVNAYVSNGMVGAQVAPNGGATQVLSAGRYVNGALAPLPPSQFGLAGPADATALPQTLNLHTGRLTTRTASGAAQELQLPGGTPRDWQRLWAFSDIVIDGDPEAQQVTHSNLFYLLSSSDPLADHSIPPMGLSSTSYNGHIFWDAEVWMLPALIVQHPLDAKSIVDYRFKRLGQARKNAARHGYKGAEFPWESADTGEEVAPAEFAQERHITADVAFAAWQYYLWTGDKAYLTQQGWPVLQATAQYWTSRVTRGSDGKYHINRVLSPDETAGLVDDDAFTNAAVRYNLIAAAEAAGRVGKPADPRWREIASKIAIPHSPELGIPAEHAGMKTERFSAKQADTLLLLHPLNVSYDAATAGKMLDFYAAHTSKNGPAMTSSIHAVVAAKLGRGQQSLDEFRNSYRPFMRGPWNAFSEKRTTNNVYFLTGMAGSLQSILYGFAGLQIQTGKPQRGTKIASADGVTLTANPHLPPGWNRLEVRGIRFHGKLYDLTVESGNRVTVKAGPPGV